MLEFDINIQNPTSIFNKLQKLEDALIEQMLTAADLADRAPCAEKDTINVIDEPIVFTHIWGNYLPFQTFEIPKKNSQPLCKRPGWHLTFNGLLRSSEKWKF